MVHSEYVQMGCCLQLSDKSILSVAKIVCCEIKLSLFYMVCSYLIDKNLKNSYLHQTQAKLLLSTGKKNKGNYFLILSSNIVITLIMLHNVLVAGKCDYKHPIVWCQIKSSKYLHTFYLSKKREKINHYLFCETPHATPVQRYRFFFRYYYFL
jgi:hypothetical protein